MSNYPPYSLPSSKNHGVTNTYPPATSFHQQGGYPEIYPPPTQFPAENGNYHDARNFYPPYSNDFYSTSAVSYESYPPTYPESFPSVPFAATDSYGSHPSASYDKRDTYGKFSSMQETEHPHDAWQSWHRDETTAEMGYQKETPYDAKDITMGYKAETIPTQNKVAESTVLPPLPPLPDPECPLSYEGIPLETLYAAIREMRREIEHSERREEMREALMEEVSVLLGVAKVLHESGMLYPLENNPNGSDNLGPLSVTRKNEDDEENAKKGEDEESEKLTPFPYPIMKTPALPPGYTSWLHHPEEDTMMAQEELF